MIIRNARDLGLLIRKHRDEQSLTQDDLANQIGASRYWIIDIEKGKPTAQIGFVLRVLTALGLDVDIGPEVPTTDPESVDQAPRHAVDLDHVLSGSTGSNLDLDEETMRSPAQQDDRGASSQGNDRGDR